LARDINGSLSWINIGSISLQPAEFAKCFTAIEVAKYMSRYGYRVRDLRDLFIPFAIIAVPMMIIMVAQRDTGSALVFLSFLLVFYREGMSGYVLLWGVFSILLFIIVIRFGGVAVPVGTGNVGILAGSLLIEAITVGLLVYREKDIRIAIIVAISSIATFAIGLILNIWVAVNFNYVALASLIVSALMLCVLAFKQRRRHIYWIIAFVALETILCQGVDTAFHKVLQPHQRTRIEVLLGIKDDPIGAGYNVNQSKIAIGSGQFLGKGWTKGTQTALKFVPEQDTDFIFCTVGEEWGFVGSAGLLMLYLALILRIIFLAERQRDRFSMIYAYCVASILLMHVTINIGMVLGLLPVIGIPLPFISYGGSSLWAFTFLLFIFIKQDALRQELI
jgi:rod shape determining protein RodA